MSWTIRVGPASVMFGVNESVCSIASRDNHTIVQLGVAGTLGKPALTARMPKRIDQHELAWQQALSGLIEN